MTWKSAPERSSYRTPRGGIGRYMTPGLLVARPGDHPRAASRSTYSTTRRASGRDHAAAASRSGSASSQSTRRGPGTLGQSSSGSGGRPTIFLASLCDVCAKSPRRLRSSHRATRAFTAGSDITRAISSSSSSGRLASARLVDTLPSMIRPTASRPKRRERAAVDRQVAGRLSHRAHGETGQGREAPKGSLDVSGSLAQPGPRVAAGAATTGGRRRRWGRPSGGPMDTGVIPSPPRAFGIGLSAPWALRWLYASLPSGLRRTADNEGRLGATQGVADRSLRPFWLRARTSVRWRAGRRFVRRGGS